MNRSAAASRAQQNSFVDAFQQRVAFLNRPRIVTPSCLVLDVSLPDLNELATPKNLWHKAAAIDDWKL